MQRLSPTANRRQGLDRDPGNVVERLLRGEGHACTCVWNLSIDDFGCFGAYRSIIKSCQRTRAALNLATSSKKSLWQLKKKERRGAKASTSRPRETASSTYCKALANVNASSCAAVEPASRMWYPEMLMVFHRGT